MRIQAGSHLVFEQDCTVKNNSCFSQSDICIGYEGKTGKERDFVILKDKPMNNHID